MKRIAILISGAPAGDNLRDLEIAPGATAGDVLAQLGLGDGWMLSDEGSMLSFAHEETIDDRVRDGAKLRAVPVAEVGVFA